MRRQTKENVRKIYLIKNTAIFAFGNISTKFIHFFLVPFYTYTLSTKQYGMIDTINSICTMLIPIIMCNIGESIRRYLLDRDSDSNKIRAIEFFWIIIGFVVSVIMYEILLLIPNLQPYAIYISAFSFSSALFQTTQDYLRGQERLKSYTVCSILSSLGIAVLNILFLVKLNLGIEGYFLSYIIMYLISALVALIAGKQYQQIVNIRWDTTLFKEMTFFSLTLVPNSIMWWVTNSSDRIMVTYMVSAAANGLYSISYKLPSLMSTFNTILMQAWQYSAIKESGKSDREIYNNKMFRFYFATTAIVAAILLLILKPFMRLYVSPDYYNAWIYSPFLIVGMMYQTLGTFVGTTYYVEKDMKGNLVSATIGAITNVVLNFCFIPIIGTNGAAIATCISYIVILVYRVIDTHKYLNLNVVSSYTVKLSFTIVFMLGAEYIPFWISYLLLLIGCIVIFYFTREYYITYLQTIIKKIFFHRLIK